MHSESGIKFYPCGNKTATKSEAIQRRVLEAFPTDWFQVVVCTKFENKAKKFEPLYLQPLEWEVFPREELCHENVLIVNDALREEIEKGVKKGWSSFHPKCGTHGKR